MRDVLKITVINIDYNTNQEVILGESTFQLELLQHIDSSYICLPLENNDTGGEINVNLSYRPY